MPTLISTVWEMVVEAEQMHLSRVQAENSNLVLQNERLQDQIHDLRYHLQMKREIEGRRRRWQISRQARMESRTYHR